MAAYLYLDHSNLFIEGRRVSAVHHGWAGTIWQSTREHILDRAYRLDYRQIWKFVFGDEPRSIGRAFLVASVPHLTLGEPAYLRAARRAGFEVSLHQRNVFNREKAVDMDLAMSMVEDAIDRMDPDQDVINLVAGDADYAEPVRRLRRRRFVVRLLFWAHAAASLRQASSEFIALDPYVRLFEHRGLTPTA